MTKFLRKQNFFWWFFVICTAVALGQGRPEAALAAAWVWIFAE